MGAGRRRLGRAVTYYWARLAVIAGALAVTFAVGMFVQRRRRESLVPAPEDMSQEGYPLHDSNPEMLEYRTRLSAILDHTIDGWFDWRCLEGVEYYSPRFAAILGYEPGELPNTPAAWMDRIHPVDLEMAMSNFDEHVRTRGEHPYWQIVRYTHREGHEIRVICRGAVVEWGEDGQPVRMIGTHIDVTDYVPAEVVGCAGGNCHAE
jgi:PAS domain S-box-containing protein